MTEIPYFPQEIGAIPGRVTHDSCQVKAWIPKAIGTHADGTILHLSLSTDPPPSFPGFPVTGLGAPISVGIDEYQVATFDAVNLQPFARYYGGLKRDPVAGEWIGEPICFKTLPDPEDDGAFVIKWAAGSCQMWWDNPDMPKDENCQIPEDAWADLIEFQPDILFALGDDNYQGGNKPDAEGNPKWGPDGELTTWNGMCFAQSDNLPTMRQARALVAQEQLSDDHEFSANNGESIYPYEEPGGENLRGYQRSIQMQAIQKIFPVRDPERIHGVFYHFWLTKRIRVIVVDCESLERAYGQVPDYDGKTFFGTTQDQWLAPLLTDGGAVLNIMVSSKAWLGNMFPTPDGAPRVDDTDKVWAYPLWRINVQGIIESYDGGHAEAPLNVLHLAGDRQFVAFDDGSHNQWGGFPCIVASAWLEHTLAIRPDEVYQCGYPPQVTDPTAQEMHVIARQSVRGTIEDDGAGTIRVTVDIRYFDRENRVMTSLTPHPMCIEWHYTPTGWSGPGPCSSQEAE